MNDIADFAIVGLVAYLATGIALTGYDFSAPPQHRKMYVIQRNYKAAIRYWFLWPLLASFEAYQEQRLRGRRFRFAVGVLSLVVGMVFWCWVAAELLAQLVGPAWLAAVLTIITSVLASPILTAIVMPVHGRH